MQKHRWLGGRTIKKWADDQIDASIECWAIELVAQCADKGFDALPPSAQDGWHAYLFDDAWPFDLAEPEQEAGWLACEIWYSCEWFCRA